MVKKGAVTTSANKRGTEYIVVTVVYSLHLFNLE